MTTTHLTIGATDTVLGHEADARAAFAARRALVCRDAIEQPIVDRLVHACARATFVSDHVDGLGHRTIERPAVAGTTVALLLRRPPLYRWLERVTGCGSITSIEGRVVRTYPVAGDELTWHDDMGGDRVRRLGVTIALSSVPYDGGEFEMRPVGGETLTCFKHDRAGTMLIFAVSSALEHRVHPLTAGGPRQVFTGWFLG